MIKIFKYELDFHLTNPVALHLPKGADILDVQYQSGRLCLWAMVDVDVDAQASRRIFHCLPTGGEVPRYRVPLQYLKTVQNGPLVWHIFEEVM